VSRLPLWKSVARRQAKRRAVMKKGFPLEDLLLTCAVEGDVKSANELQAHLRERRAKPVKGGKNSGTVRKGWHAEARDEARAMLRDGKKRSEIVGALAVRYKRTKETMRDVLRDVLPAPR